MLLLASLLFGCSSPAESCSQEDPDCLTADTGEYPAPLSRYARLTHQEWQNSVRDLLDLPELEDYSHRLRSDPSQGGYLFDNDANSLSVDRTLWQAYQRAAGDIAAYVVASPERLEAVAPEGESKVEAFIERFGAQAHRRPLTDEQVQAYTALHGRGPEFFPEVPAFEAGVRLVLEAMLQSPYFLYRVELSDDVHGGLARLDGYEVASRLSYALWDTMPDEKLRKAAASGDLLKASKVAEQARRMLKSRRAVPVLSSFHRQLFGVDRYRNIQDEPRHLNLFAEEEHLRFVHHVVVKQRGSLTDLLTSTETYVNGPLAELYGLEGDYADKFQLVDLDPLERSGFLTQVGFLASNANSGTPDPIHRGIFLAQHLACLEIPVPPGEIPPLPSPMGRTNRETVEAHTEIEGSVCINCHATFINPFGFPFEYYDGAGRYRTEDNGHPVDGTAEVRLGKDTLRVSNGVELSQVLAGSLQVHKCYANHWLQFAFGRNGAKEDEALVERLGTASLEGTLSTVKLIEELVSSQAFRTRDANGAE